MKYRDFKLPYWNQISPAQRRELAQELSENIPGFQFIDIQLYELGEKKNFVAFFNWNNIEFALIPGGEVTLGYDRNNPFIPNEAQLEAWEYTREEYGCELNRHLRKRFITVANLTPLPPFPTFAQRVLLGHGKWGLKPLSLQERGLERGLFYFRRCLMNCSMSA